MQKHRAFVQMVLASNWSLQIHWASPTIRGKYSESRTSQSSSHPICSYRLCNRRKSGLGNRGRVRWIEQGSERARSSTQNATKLWESLERTGKKTHIGKIYKVPAVEGLGIWKPKQEKPKAWFLLLQKAKYTVCLMKFRSPFVSFMSTVHVYMSWIVTYTEIYLYERIFIPVKTLYINGQ